MSGSHVAPTRAQAIALLQRGIEGPFVMLNLLRFREVADYSAAPDLRPAVPISGGAAFDLYVDASRPHLEARGVELSNELFRPDRTFD